MNEGKITYLSTKGFGFIKSEGRTKDLFFHAKELIDIEFFNLAVGDNVTFENTEVSEKGIIAKGVRVINN